MTREDAIKELTELLPEEFLSEYTDAIKMAIRALEQEPCGDCISRQKLLKAIATLDKFGCNADTKLVPYKDHYVPYIRYYDVISCIKLAFPVTLQQKPCDDAISRKKVIDTIYCECSCENLDIDFAKVLLLQRAIKALPPVTPKPKMGKWLIKRVGDYDHAICSVCGDDSYLSPEWDALELYKYCPNCGAKMQEVEE